MEGVRVKASEVLESLAREVDDDEVRFWIPRRGGGENGGADAAAAAAISDTCRFFHRNGFVRIPSFCSPEECRRMKGAMSDLVERNWKPDDELDSFGTNSKENRARGDYFLESSDKIHFFAEPTALQEEEVEEEAIGGCSGDGETTEKERARRERPRRRSLVPEYQNRKVEALNKVGHALHLSQPGNGDPSNNGCAIDNRAFHEYAFSAKVRNLVSDLGWNDPIVPQSMYIFKQARIGGAVTSHQDSTFLYTEPYQTCLGLWLALDDATLENGCLWVRPKSHWEPVRRQYKRNVAHFGSDAVDARKNHCISVGDGTLDEPKLVMEELYEHNVSWDGGLPGQKEEGDDTDVVQSLLDVGFIPIECRAGDLLAFCGELDHLSLPNTSDSPRHTFQLHLVEGPSRGVVWSKWNWLQYPNGKPFARLKDLGQGQQ